jgi:3-oxoadipate enol-lactonase
MAFLTCGNALIHYTDAGYGEPIITLHGLSESGLYWTLPGITDQLVSAGYRVINMDMRGHGYSSVSGTDKGYNIETLVEDINLLAEHLGFQQFHLLTHATGGMVGFRYAMQYSYRLLSVMATNTGSATVPNDEICDVAATTVDFPKIDMTQLPMGQELISTFRGQSWSAIHAATRVIAKEHMYFNRMHTAVNPESAFAMYEACSGLAEPDEIADFIAEFYTDTNPHIAGLRNIQCPCLMLEGEFDVQFLKPAELVAREVPNCRHTVLDGMGHMLAFENPERLATELKRFLKRLAA